MKHSGSVLALALGLFATVASAQVGPVSPPAADAPRERPRKPIDPVEGAAYRSSPLALSDHLGTAILYEPKGTSKPGVMVVSFDHLAFNRIAVELATRGYKVLYVHSPEIPEGQYESPLSGFAQLSAAIRQARAMPGVQKIVLTGWGGGATSATLYANVSANGPAACQKTTLVYPCTAAEARELAAPDGLILFDPGPGAASRLSNIDPTFDNAGKRTRLEMDHLSARNGYDAATGAASYQPAFRQSYFAAQASRNAAIIAQARARLSALDTGGDEPLATPGAESQGGSLSLHYTDLSLLSRTKKPHLLLKADGTSEITLLRSIRAATGPVGEEAVRRAEARRDAPPRGSTLRDYLANDAIRTNGVFALTEDDMTGIDWASALASPPGQAAGVRVPALIMTNTCFQFVVPGELVVDRLGSADKEQVGVEGSEHFLNACGPQYGDTKGRLFDYVANWLAKPGRFIPRP